MTNGTSINSISGRLGGTSTTSNSYGGDQYRRHENPSPRKQIKTRDAGCCSVNLVTYTLHMFNMMFLISGVAITVIATWTILWKHEYISLFGSLTYWLITYSLLATGIFAMFAAVWGCCGIRYENRSMLCCYSVLLILIFAMEFSIGGSAYIYETQVDDELVHSMNETFVNNYGIDRRRTIAIDSMQQNFRCCGAIRFEDWRASTWLNAPVNSSSLVRPNDGRVVPDSCCITYREKCGKSDHPSNIPYSGCIYKFIDETRDHLNILAAAGSGLCFIQLFGFILSCCLIYKLKKVSD